MNDLIKAIEVIKQGGIVIFPTDTAFGIGCRVDDSKAIDKLYKIRKRPLDKAMPVLFDSFKRVDEFVLPYDEKVKNLMKKYWPGALTIILNCKIDMVPESVRGGKTSLGVRIPNHDTILSLIEGAETPITGSSANFAGEKTPFTFEALDKRLLKLVDFVLEGKTNSLNTSSTVVDTTVFPYKIIRQGSIILSDYE